MAPPALSTIHLLSELCDASTQSAAAIAATASVEDHYSFLTILDWKIKHKSTSTQGIDDADTIKMMELFQLAMLVYLNRTSEDALRQATLVEQQIERAFDLISQMGHCDRHLPVFILGCEARTDHQRTEIMDLITRSESGASSRTFSYVRILLSAIWTQDDFGHIGYWDKLDYMISCCATPPLFV
jgi:hypothetical protein